jgi:hypothetical protein
MAGGAAALRERRPAAKLNLARHLAAATPGNGPAKTGAERERGLATLRRAGRQAAERLSTGDRSMNPDNSVVRFCAEGMRAEQEGRHAGARARFEQA